MDENTNTPGGLEELQTFLDSAVALHGMFLNFMAAGFNERQAIQLIAEMVMRKS